MVHGDDSPNGIRALQPLPEINLETDERWFAQLSTQIVNCHEYKPSRQQFA
eukprot:GSA25T00016428001.1